MDLFGSQEGGNFADPPLAAAQELPYADLLAMEKEVTGLYLTGHPLKPYEPVYKVLRADRTDRILTSLEEGNGDYRDGGTVRVLGMLTSCGPRPPKTTLPWPTPLWRICMVRWKCWCFRRLCRGSFP